MKVITHLDLFSGIGGMSLASESAGILTVGFCEWADYPTKVLEKHWPDVPKWRDIRTLTRESFYEQTGLRTVDVVSGGFPCQPFSVAGKRRGKEDDRYLWPELLRVIQEIRPDWFVGENVAGIVTMALDTVLSDLENIGYTAQPFIIPACAVDAPHRRDRCAIVAYADSGGRIHGRPEIKPAEAGEYAQCNAIKRGEDVSDTESDGLQRERAAREQERRTRLEKGKFERRCHVRDGERWPVEPGVGRVANGVPNRVDRIKCLGNAVVPAQFYPIFKAIAEIENGQQAD